MHLAYLNLVPGSDLPDPESYHKSSIFPQQFLLELKKTQATDISIVQRTSFDIIKTIDDISYHFITDEFKSELRWWQEPESIFQVLADIHPDLIHVNGLDLPLQFRWLRRIVGDNVKIVGEHTGKTFWAQRNLWLQQFGLRVVDGFIFKSLEEAQAWIKASVILDKQPVIEIPSLTKNPKEAAKSLIEFYKEL
jgi:hypothetical protein